MKVEKIDLTNLPSDVASNIASFMVGKPEELRLKHNEALKKIQRKYMINSSPTFKKRDNDEYISKLNFYIARWQVSFPITSLNHIIMKQANKLREMMHEELQWYEDEAEETCYDYSSFLLVSARIETIDDSYITYSQMNLSYHEMEDDLETITQNLQSNIETHIAPHKIITGISQLNFKLECVFHDSWILWYIYFN